MGKSPAQAHTQGRQGPFSTHPPPKLVQMLGGVSTSSACIGTLDKRGFQACDQGSTCRHASQSDRPPRKQLPQPLSRNKVLYVTMSRAVSMYAMLAAYGHHVVRCFGVHPTDRRPQGDVETDPVPETRDNETTETPTGALC